MDHLPNSAIAIALGLLVIVWAFLVHMLMSQAPDSHLQFLLDLIAEEEHTQQPPPPGSAPRLTDVLRIELPRKTVCGVAGEAKQYAAQHACREVPLLFATSLRGRGL